MLLYKYTHKKIQIDLCFPSYVYNLFLLFYLELTLGKNQSWLPIKEKDKSFIGNISVF